VEVREMDEVVKLIKDVSVEDSVKMFVRLSKRGVLWSDERCEVMVKKLSEKIGMGLEFDEVEKEYSEWLKRKVYDVEGWCELMLKFYSVGFGGMVDEKVVRGLGWMIERLFKVCVDWEVKERVMRCLLNRWYWMKCSEVDEERMLGVLVGGIDVLERLEDKLKE